ncbi:hypothetical protein CsSME_00010965 [Camellia sinensis var. sinensis]
MNTGDGLTDSMHGLSSTELPFFPATRLGVLALVLEQPRLYYLELPGQVKSVVDWRDFYFKTYM